jgi:hypothetical protein
MLSRVPVPQLGLTLRRTVPVTPIHDAVTQAKGHSVSLVATSDRERAALPGIRSYAVLAGGNVGVASPAFGMTLPRVHP